MKKLEKKEPKRNFKIQKNEREKGITLIALVITIIVLLILAGVTIATLTGNNGVLTKATEAKDETTQSTAEEMVSLAIGSLQTKNLGDRSQITPEAIANQVMEDNDIENVTAEGSEFPTNIVFADDGIKVGVNLNFEVGEISSYDGIYSEPGLEGKVAPEDLFDYEIIADGASAATGMDSLPERTVIITGIKPEYCNGGRYNSEGKYETTNYEIKCDSDVITEESLLVIPYQVDGKYIPNGIEGELYTVTEVNLYVSGQYPDGGAGVLLPEIETIIFPNTVEEMIGEGPTAYINETIKKVILSEQQESINKRAFYYCESLANIVIPESVTNIGNGAFESCSALKSVTYKSINYTSKTELMEALEANGVTCATDAFNWTGLSD